MAAPCIGGGALWALLIWCGSSNPLQCARIVTDTSSVLSEWDLSLLVVTECLIKPADIRKQA